MCLSVLEKFSEYKSYNIQSLAKTEEEIKNEKNKLIKLNEQKKDEEEKEEKEKSLININNNIHDKIEVPNDDDEIDLI